MDINSEYYKVLSSRAQELIEFAKARGWTEEELHQAVELIGKMIRLSP